MNDTFSSLDLVNSSSGNVIERLYIVTGVAHILFVVVPSILLGFLLLSLLIEKKKYKDPIFIVFVCTTGVCMLGACSHNLLMDISVITDWSIIGECGTTTAVVYWMLSSVFHHLLLSGGALLMSFSQYAIVKWGKKGIITPVRVAVTFVLLVVGSVIISAPINAGAVFDTYKARGSLCTYSPTASVVILVTSSLSGIFVSIPLSVAVVVFCCLIYREAKRGLLEDVKAVKSVLAVALSMISAIVLSRIPYFFSVLRTSNEDYNRLLSWAIPSISDINYPVFIILMILIHKSTREKLKAKILKVWRKLKKPTRVVPAPTANVNAQETVI